MRILIVDDDMVVLKTTAFKLTQNGYAVTTAVDGAEAIQAVRQEKPDLILLDIHFPPDVAHGGGVGWDGFLLMSWLRRFGGGATIPVILITGASPTFKEPQALTSQALACFRKPLDFQALLPLIEQTLARSAFAPAAAGTADFQI